MNSKKVEQELLNILKIAAKNKNLSKTLYEMVKGKYVFKSDILNELSITELMLYIEKFINIGTKSSIKVANCFKDVEVFKKNISKFRSVLPNLTQKKLSKDKKNKRYNFLIKKEYIRNKIEKSTKLPMGVVISVMLMGVTYLALLINGQGLIGTKEPEILESSYVEETINIDDSFLSNTISFSYGNMKDLFDIDVEKINSIYNDNSEINNNIDEIVIDNKSIDKIQEQLVIVNDEANKEVSVQSLDENNELSNELEKKYAKVADIKLQLEELRDKQSNNYENNELIKELTIEKTVLTAEIIREKASSLTNDKKKIIILDSFKLATWQFDILMAIAMAEAAPSSYVDGCCVINTVVNRINSISWNNFVNAVSGKEMGTNIYNQATASGQFEVYFGEEQRYKNYLGIAEGEVYQAVIDALYMYLEEGVLAHDFLSFTYADSRKTDVIQFTEGGNKYYQEFEEKDRLDLKVNEKTR